MVGNTLGANHKTCTGAKWQILLRRRNGKQCRGGKMTDNGRPRNELADNAPEATWQFVLQERNGKESFGGGLVGGDIAREKEHLGETKTASRSTSYVRLRRPPTVSSRAGW